MRHLGVQYLWIQQKLAEKQFKLGPVSTVINPSDLGTKALQINRLQFLLGLLGVVDSHREHELVGKDEMSKEFHNQQFREKLKEALKVLRCNEHFGLSHYSNDMILAKKVIHVCMVSGVLSAADGASLNSEENSPDHFMLIVCGTFLILLRLAFLLGWLFGKCSTKVNTAGMSVGVQCNLAERVVVPRSQRSMLAERIAVCPSFGTAYHTLTCGYIQRASVTKEYSPCAICFGGTTVASGASSSSATQVVPEPLHEDSISARANESVRRRVQYHRRMRHQDPSAEPEEEVSRP